MDSPFVCLGDREFVLPTHWSGLKGKDGVDYAEHKVIEGKPVTQYIGDQAEELTVTIELSHRLCDPVSELDRLRGMMAEHKAWPLVFGNGLYKGRYIFTSIDTTTEVTDAAGTPLFVTVEISLKEYVAPPEVETVSNPPGVGADGGKAAAKKAGSAYRVETGTNPDGVSVQKLTRAPQ